MLTNPIQLSSSGTPSSQRRLWLPVLPLAAAAAMLVFLWKELPEHWVIHWGIRGEPNGWSERSFFGVFGPLVMGALTVAIVEVARVAVRRRALAKPKQQALFACEDEMLGLTSFGVSLLFACLTVSLPFDGNPVLYVGGPMIVIIVAAIRGVKQRAVLLREMQASGEHGDLAGYRWYGFYRPQDQRLLVPKLSGLGWTVNIGHPMGRRLLALGLLLPLALLISTLWPR